VTVTKLGAAFSGSAGPYALTLGSAIGLAVAIAVVPVSLRPKALEGARKGAASMLSPLTILVAAWALGAVLKDLGTADQIGSLLGSALSPTLLPAAVFLCAAAVAFFTGTSWGTMGLMMPLAIPMAAATAIGRFAEPRPAAPTRHRRRILGRRLRRSLLAIFRHHHRQCNRLRHPTARSRDHPATLRRDQRRPGHSRLPRCRGHALPADPSPRRWRGTLGPRHLAIPHNPPVESTGTLFTNSAKPSDPRIPTIRVY
jgi:hypothetical protein